MFSLYNILNYKHKSQSIFRNETNKNWEFLRWWNNTVCHWFCLPHDTRVLQTGWILLYTRVLYLTFFRFCCCDDDGCGGGENIVLSDWFVVGCRCVGVFVVGCCCVGVLLVDDCRGFRCGVYTCCDSSNKDWDCGVYSVQFSSLCLMASRIRSNCASWNIASGLELTIDSVSSSYCVYVAEGLPFIYNTTYTIPIITSHPNQLPSGKLLKFPQLEGF